MITLLLKFTSLNIHGKEKLLRILIFAFLQTKDDPNEWDGHTCNEITKVLTNIYSSRD